ncbi:MAG: DNA topoisomerase 3 [Planctomycetota bacterium]
MVRVVVAEKPSVARELAGYLGADRRRDGYLEGDGVCVTWAFGHLVGLQEPHDYDSALKRWSLATLPILPAEFKLKVLGDERSRKQYAVVARLLRQADDVVCGTDAGREGELIFRYIVALAGVAGKPTQRLWLSSLTRDAIGAGFASLRPIEAYDRLFDAARCRSESDWLVGLNATRAYTVRYGGSGVLWSVGRVQTPVLAMVAARDDEIRTFVSIDYYDLHTHYREVRFRRQGERLGKDEAARALLERLRAQPLVVTKVQAREERLAPPLLHDLTALQRDMNERFGLSAAQTLEAAQKLYEGKLITYPRTDARHLPRGMHATVQRTLRDLAKIRPRETARIDVDTLPQPPRVFDDGKVGDHHAIVPTGRLPGELSPRERQVFDAVATRLIAAFYPDHVRSVTSVDATVAEVAFRATGVRVLEAGWKVLEQGKRSRAGKAGSQAGKDDDDEAQDLPAFAVGETGSHRPELLERATTPPRPYTDGSLLQAMETAGRLVDDEELKAALKAKGLGTPATRAAIIETLLHRAYLVRDKKALRVTDLGRYLIALVPHDELKSPALTGEWEGKLEAIARGEARATDFMAAIAGYARELVVRSGGTPVDGERLGPCPRCGKEVIAGQRGYGCSGWQGGCAFVLWREYRGATLEMARVRELLQRRVTSRPCVLPDVGPRILCLTAGGVVIDLAVPSAGSQRAGRPAPPRDVAAAKAPPARTLCPRCRGPMGESADAYACRSAPPCGFAIAKVIAGKAITRAMARALATKGRTRVLQGFRGRSGREFAARLRLDAQGRIGFEVEGGSQSE